MSAELVAVHARVSACLAGDPDAVLAPGALADAAALMAAAADPRHPVDPVEAACVLGWLHWCRFHELAPGEAEQASGSASLHHFRLVIDTSPELVPPGARAVIVRAALAGDDRQAAATLGAAMLSASARTTDADLLDRAVDLLSAAVEGVAVDGAAVEGAASAVWCDDLAGALHLRYERTGAATDLERAAVASQRATGLAAPDDPLRARFLTNRSLVLRSKGSAADLDLAVAAAREAAALTPAPAYLSNLGIALLARHGTGGSPGDRAEAVDVLRAAVRTAPAGDHQRHLYLSNLSSALLSGSTPAIADLDEALTAARQALAETIGEHPERWKHLSNTATALRRRHAATGSAGDLDDAIAARRQALTLVPPGHPRHSALAADLVIDVRRRMTTTPSAEDLELTLGTLRAALDGAPDDPVLLTNLGVALLTRFAWHNDLDDVDRSVALHRRALRAGAAFPSRWRCLGNLGAALRIRFEHTGDPADIDESVAVRRAAIALAPDDAYLLLGLCGALRSRYDATSREDDLDEAVAVGREAMAVATDPAEPANNLSFALRRRFDRTGDRADLDEAVRLGRLAVTRTDEDLAGALSNLGLALHTRYEYTDALDDLDEAVDRGADALRQLPPGSPIRHRFLSNLGIAHLERFDRTAVADDLVDAAGLARAAVDATPAGHPRRPIYLSNLGLALLRLYETTGRTPERLAGYVAVQREALESGATGDADHSLLLSNLSMALATRFGASGTRGDLDESIALQRQAIAAVPAGHGGAGTFWANLGSRLYARYDRLGHAADLTDAIAAWRQGAQIPSAPVPVRVEAASMCAATIAGTSGPAAAADVYTWTIKDLLPLLAWRGVGREDQLHQLRTYAGALARDGAACTFAAARPADALAHLEQGRGVLWSRLLELRGDLTGLAAADAGLADRLAGCRRAIDHQDALTGHRR
ncbi:tetratricopeptide repeat protein [Dactylosporangium sp. NPDC005555]|uniref:tetratricopeptide repeat protein n=1 Tax=Dactylosporangium sp. NPDC005555 TaxID=3154889 RepID=UPI0033A96ADD